MTYPTAPVWSVASLNDEVLPESTDPEREISYIDIGSVSRERGVEITSTMLFADAPSRARRVVRCGDVIVSTVRTYLRAVARIDEEHDECVASTGFAALRARPQQDSRFLGYALLDPVFVDRVVANSVGVSYPAITGSALTRLRVSSPPVSRQARVADFLDQESERISAAVASAAAVVPETTRALGGLTDEVPITALRRLKFGLHGPLTYGASENSNEGDIDWPRFIRITDIDQHGELRADVRRLPPEVAAPYLLSDGDVLLARSGATVGKSFLYDAAKHGLCCYAGYLVRARCNRRELLPEFLLLATMSDRWWDQIGLALTQATIPNVSAARYAEMLVPMPPIAAQSEILQRAHDVRRATSAVRAHHHALSKRLVEYRDSLIHEAVTGKLDVTQASERQMDERLHAAAENRLDEVPV